MKETIIAQKACTNCGVVKPLLEFHLSSKASDGRASWCKVCTNSIARAARKRLYNPAAKRRWQLHSRYGLTPEDVEKLHGQQEGKCALCPTDLKKFHIDHDHNTGIVRGLLCHRCNIRLGGWDDLQWRVRAMAYLGLNDNQKIQEAA